jgi:molybdopterin synthase sulfur carrier subunit
MVKVRIPTPLRPMTGGKSEVETQASDIQAMIESLNGQFPGLKSRICDDAGEIRRFVNIYLNEEDIRFMKGKDTPLKDGDQISIVPAIAGGAEESGGCDKDQTTRREAIPAALNNHQAFGSSKLGMAGGSNRKGAQ